ncbi:peptidylprolyl isomerase [Luteimonas sp. MJ293]|uniref:FKBP-type peptidyl-prolyl cis-trans isomerase n=1 Tax=Luteimonas sp. MJ146 TaxID=3129240 RepID=UPI0031B9DB2E
MEIASNRVASIHYTLTNDEGQVIDRSPEDQPLSYLHGAGNIVPGLERALEGKNTGDTFKVDVSPNDGYGPRNDALVQTVPREAFQGVDSIEPGMQFKAQTDNGPLVVTVAEVDDSQVKIDGNHPLAGQTLHFAIEVAEVREASEQEKQVGHVGQPQESAD